MNQRARKKSILVVGARGIPSVEGGAEKNAEALFPRLVARGWDVSLTVLKSNWSVPQFGGVNLLSAPEFRLLNTEKLPYYLFAPFLVLTKRPAIVHLQGLGAALFLFVYKAMGCRVVVRYGSADYVTGKWGAIGRAGFRFAERQLHLADGVIAVAQSLKLRLAEIGISKNVVVIENALDHAFRGASSDAATRHGGSKYILVVGRVTAQKNIHSVLVGYRRYRDNGGRLDLVIAGGLEDEGYVRSLANLTVDGCVFLGKVPREAVAELMSRCTMYINMSIHEGHSNASMEAISNGCPILVSDIPENRDMHLPEQCYVDLSGAETMASAIRDCESEKDNYVVGHERFLSWEQVADRTEQLYVDILAGSTLT